MSRMESSEDYLPAYIDLNPLRRMKSVAGKMALVKRAVAEMASIEDALTAFGAKPTYKDLDLAKKEMVRFAKIIAKSSRSAAVILKSLKKDIIAYRKDLADATG